MSDAEHREEQARRSDDFVRRLMAQREREMEELRQHHEHLQDLPADHLDGWDLFAKQSGRRPW